MHKSVKDVQSAELFNANYARSLIEASLDPLVTISAEGKILDVNEASIKVTGVSREKLIGTDFSNYFTEPTKAQEGYRQVFEKGFVADYPLTIKHQNNKLTDVLYNASVYKDDKGNVLGVFAAARDVTDAKEADTALRKKTQTLAVGSAVAGLAIIEIDYASNFAHLTDEAAKMYFGPDAQAQSVSRQSLHETFHPDNLETLKNLIEKSLDPNGTGLLQIDHRVIWPNGEVRWLKVSKQVFFNRLGLTAKPEYSILAAQDITNIKEAQEKLQGSEERIRLATKASGVGVWEWNVITNKIRWDAEMFRIYGIAPTADGLIEYSTWSNAVAPEDLAAQEKMLQDTVKNVGTSNRSFKISRANDGIQCFIEAIETVRLNAVGQAEWVVGTNLDVTEQKQASKYARSLIEASLDPLVTISVSGKILDVNEASVKVTGVPREKLIDTDFSNYFTEPTNAQEGYRQVFEKGFVEDYPLTIKHKNGNLTDVLYNASIYKDDNGNVLGVFAAARDVTEQKQSSQYARSLIEASLDPLVTISAAGKILDVNAASVKVTGVPREKLIDTDFSNYFTEPQRAQEGYQQVFEKGFVADYPLTIKHKNGNLTDVLYNASVYKDDKGNVLGVFAAARDVTEQKKSSQYARSLIEASLDPLVTISADGKILDVNEASIKVTGIAREKLIDTDFSNYFTEPVKAQEGYRQVFEKGFVADYPLTIKHKNGNLTDVLYNASVYKDDKGNVLGVFAAARDVTEQTWAKDLRIANKELAFQNEEKEKRAQELSLANKKLAFENEEKEKRAAELIIANKELAFQNEEKEKRAAELVVANNELAFQNDEKEKRAAELVVANKELLAFTYISSHDLQEPLRKIQTFVTIILENEAANLSENGKYNFERMQLAARRMQQLIDDLLAFSRINTTELVFENIALNSIVDEVKNELKDTIQEKKAIVEYSELGSANIIAFQFRQLVYNLISNALKFSSPDRTPHIIIKNKIVLGSNSNIESLSPQKKYAHITFKDNGIGFETQFNERIFEVFQKLHGKEIYAGTGIGLAIVKKIIENHGGTIVATSELNNSAQFDIYIPA